MKLVVLLITLAVAGVANADVMHVTSVVQGCDGGFCGSHFHETTADPEVGSPVATVDAADGIYNTDTGVLDLTITASDPALSGRLYGTLEFENDSWGLLESPALLTYETADATMYFGLLPGKLCCWNRYGANSLQKTVAPGNIGTPGPWEKRGPGWLMTTWGALVDPDAWLDNPSFDTYLTGVDGLGLDLRVVYTPEPEAWAMFLLGILGVGWLRLKRAA